MVSLYSAPNKELLEASHQTLYACEHYRLTILRVVDVKCIIAVVAMPPLPRTAEEVAAHKYENHFYLGEKPGMDTMHYTEIDASREEIDDGEDGEYENDIEEDEFLYSGRYQ